jgi:cysteine desulfuration protein SufE
VRQLADKLQEIIETFQSVDADMRLEFMLDYSRRLPPLPQRFHEQRDAGINRVPECMTPVFLWMEPEGGHLRIHVDVAEEAPTVKGFIAILVEAFDGADADQIAAAPNDLLEQLGLSDVIRMNRVVGLVAILGRIKRAAAAAGANGGS